MIAIPVDTNSMAHDGLVVASTRRVKGAIRVGDKVRVDDSAEGASFDALVAEIHDRRIYLDIDWDSQFQDVKLHGTTIVWPTFRDYVSSAHTFVVALTPAMPTPVGRHLGRPDLTLTGVPV